MTQPPPGGSRPSSRLPAKVSVSPAPASAPAPAPESSLADLERDLELQKLELARERLEVERLKLEVAQLQAGAPAPSPGNTPQRGVSERNRTARVSDRTKALKKVSSGTTPALRRSGNLPLIGAGLLAAGVAGAAAVVLALKKDPVPSGGVATSTIQPGEARPPTEKEEGDPELVAAAEALEQELAALPSDADARRTALDRLDKDVRALRREASDAQGEVPAGLALTLDTLASKLERARKALPAKREPTPDERAREREQREVELPPSQATPTTPPPPTPRPRPRPPEEDEEPAPRPVERRPPEAERPPPRRSSTQPADPEAKAAALEDAFQAALARYDEEDRPGLKKALVALEQLDTDAKETHAVRGLVAELAGRFKEATRELELAGAEGGLRVVRALLLSRFATLQFEAARELLGKLPAGEAALWGSLIDGPFEKTYPLASQACTALTPEGRYRVVTDLGLPSGHLAKLEQKLAALPEAERAKQIAKATKAHKGLQELCDVMDKAAKAFGKLLQTDEPPQVFPTVYVLQNRTDFDRFSGSLEFTGMENVLGYYVPGYRILVFYDQPEGRKPGQAISTGTLQVLLHETFHQWLHLHVEESPRWFDEGLAEYFGIGEMTSSGLRYGLVPIHHPSRLDNIREAFVYDPPLSLEELIRADRDTFYGSRASTCYAQAWSFVHYLGSTTKGQKLLRDYFKALQRGLDLDAAFREVFGQADMKAMDQDWREYVGGLR